MKYCTQCGAQNRDEAQFCTGCGIKIAGSPPTEKSVPPSAAVSKPAEPAEAVIKFNCPACKQSLEAPGELAGNQIDCPTCQQPIIVPSLSQSVTSEVKQRHGCLAVWLGLMVIANSALSVVFFLVVSPSGIKCLPCRDGRSRCWLFAGF